MPQKFVFGLMQGLAISAVMVATSRDVLRGMNQPPPTAEVSILHAHAER